MKVSRITLTQNHTGRWHLGLGDLELRALTEMLAEAQDLPVDPAAPAELIEAKCRLIDCVARAAIPALAERQKEEA